VVSFQVVYNLTLQIIEKAQSMDTPGANVIIYDVRRCQRGPTDRCHRGTKGDRNCVDVWRAVHQALTFLKVQLYPVPVSHVPVESPKPLMERLEAVLAELEKAEAEAERISKRANDKQELGTGNEGSVGCMLAGSTPSLMPMVCRGASGDTPQRRSLSPRCGATTA